MHRNLVDVANREYEPRIVEYQSFMVQRERAIAIWRELFVCTRDGSIFLPGVGEYARVEDENIGAYLWKYAR